MCGIVGFLRSHAMDDPRILNRALKCQQHRGPDDEGTWWSTDRRVGLGHRRLAIIDLSTRGHQPMSDSSGRLQIVFNGEIYNYLELRDELRAMGHTFRSDTDTEVILEAYRAWGVNCVKRLNGMFAFGLFDTESQRLFLARDRAGEKPLFYAERDRGFSFSSELKGLLSDYSVDRVIDSTALNFYLAYGYVHGSQCMIRGVNKLPAAHAMTYDLRTGHSKTWRYWLLPAPFSGPIPDTGELLDELEQLLEESVRRQLIADVPLGILLSGGIDSSLVTAIASKLSSTPVRTFTISFPGHSAFDEGPYARIVASHFGTQHTELTAEPASIDLLPALARQFDEPMADSSMIPTFLVSRLIRQHATVALGGDGGDELFGGYHHHAWLIQQQRARRYLPPSVRKALHSAATRHLPIGLRGRNYLLGYTSELNQSLTRPGLFFDQLSRIHLLSPALREAADDGPEKFKAAMFDDGRTILQRTTASDFSTYLTDDILVKVDRAAMLASLEVRAPWLDRGVVEFAFGRVPDNLRATSGHRKILPRMLAERLLPKSLDMRRKQGFSLPLGEWFKGAWGKYLEDLLGEADPQLFNQHAIQGLLDAQRRGFAQTNRLFSLSIFELWRREYRVAIPDSTNYGITASSA
jgi:asparagine synthase (glutamine-hydrolysing)